MHPRLRSRIAFAILASLTGALLLFSVFGWLPSSVSLDVGPGDADYVSGLSPEWRFEDGRTWREMRREARFRAPLRIEGPGVLTITLAGSRVPARLQVVLVDRVLDQVTIAPGRTFAPLVFTIPAWAVDTDVRLKTEGNDGSEAPLRIDRVSFRGQRIRPRLGLALQLLAIPTLSFLAFLAAGLRLRTALVVTLLLALVVSPVPPVFGLDSFARLHLIRKGALVAPLGLLIVVLARVVRGAKHAAVRSTFFIALLFKAALVFHPSYSFTDLAIHRTLVELVFHRGVVDFWTRLPEYQQIHNVGVAPVGGHFVAFPYPALFYFIVNAGNRAAHDPEFWMKLGGALASALALFPLAALARRFSSAPGADLWACLVYLLVPAYTRSLLLMEYSALLGHLMDLVALAFLARIGLELTKRRGQIGALLVVMSSLIAYTSGFLHMGLLIGGILALAPVLGGMTRRDRLRLAAASLLALVLSVATYHPKSWSNVVEASVSPSTEETNTPSEGRMDAPLTRALRFLGAPVLALGLAGTLLALKRPAAVPLRLLLASWLIAAATAYALKFGFHDLFLYQKELYFGGALLAVGEAVLLGELWMRGAWARASAVVLFLATLAAFGLEMREVFPQFYERYLFL